jgi:light-regulated signal transduction histidine kinase (bacteriophytochrome)
MDAVAVQMIQQKEIEVLLVEDSPTEAMLVIASLEESDKGSFRIVHAKSLTEAYQNLEKRSFDVVILDLTLPESSGPNTFTALHDRYPQVPVVILTANHSKDVALELVRLGAQDYIIKENVENMQLALSLRYAITRKEAELRQAALMEELAAANQELERFAYVVSHDLKAPLRGVTTIVEWLFEDYTDKLDDEGKEQMRLLVSRVQRMQKLIDGILNYSRAGRVREDLIETDLNTMLDAIVDLVSPPGHITMAVEKPFPTLACEQTRLSQVFQNLLSNAIKYMNKPQGRITVTCAEQADHWRFGVADNGQGIDRKDFERIFEIFVTLKSKDVCDSTGVGLAVVKKIVESWGGRIWVESEKGQGSTFFFTLPKEPVCRTEAREGCMEEKRLKG